MMCHQKSSLSDPQSLDNESRITVHYHNMRHCVHQTKHTPINLHQQTNAKNLSNHTLPTLHPTLMHFRSLSIVLHWKVNFYLGFSI